MSDEREKIYCQVCGKESNTGSNMCDDCLNDAVEKQRDSMVGGPDHKYTED